MQRIKVAGAKIVGRAVTFVLAFSVAAFVTTGVSQAKPPPLPPLDAGVCAGIGGRWTPAICTIPESTTGVVNTRFKIGRGITLDIQGGLTIPRGVTVDNSGAIIVRNTSGVVPSDFDPWPTGVLVYGSLDNSGTITIQGNGQGTEGITVSVSIDETGQEDPTPFVVVPGTLTNSGTIDIRNQDDTRGIKILGAVANSASGIINVANSGTTSVGIYNRRHVPYLQHPKFAINGILTNAGSVTIANSGDSDGNGMYNQGLFTNAAGGQFTIREPSPGSHDRAVGFWNGGGFTNFGRFTNDRGHVFSIDPLDVSWGSYNVAGTMINHGTTTATGTFFNYVVMINLGTITSHGVFIDATEFLTMINYGTFYNYGFIAGGVNKGICIDEKAANPSATGCQ